MAALERLGIWFIMPVPQRAPIRRAIEEYKAWKGKRASRYAAAAGNGDTFECTLAIAMKWEIAEKGKDKAKRVAAYLVYATNMPAAGMARMAIRDRPAAYKRRWAIETGYRRVEAIRARTKSNCAQARVLLFFFTMTVNNVRAMQNHAADIERARARRGKRARTRAQRRAAARLRGGAGGADLRKKYGQNVAAAECMLECWRMFACETIRRARCDRRAFIEDPPGAIRAGQ